MDRKGGDVDKKTPDVIVMVATTVLNTKIGEVKNEMPDVGRNAGLVKKTDYKVKISAIEKKYFTASDYNKFTS